MTADHHVWSTNHADPEHARRVVELARRHAVTGSTVVALDGPAGSGKSSLAALVSPLLDDAPIVHMDDLFPGWDGLAASPALLTAQVLTPLSRGERPAFRRFDWAQDAFAEMVTVPVGAFLVVEGCGSSVGIARPQTHVRVWLEAGTEQRKRRGIARDGEVFAPHWEAWARQEHELFSADDTARHAHLRFRTD